MAYVKYTAPSAPAIQILSRDISLDEAGTESQIRILIGDCVKYILVDPGAIPCRDLLFPPYFFSRLPRLPDGEWTLAHVSGEPGNLVVEVTNAKLVGVENQWHPDVVDFLDLAPRSEINAGALEVQLPSGIAIAKYARFEYEVARIAHETSIYSAIAGCSVGPAFLGHVAEHGRIMGFLIEKLEGRHAGIDDLEACQCAVKHLHSLGIVHRDVNRYNFIISPTGKATLIDFECAALKGSQEEMDLEYSSLPAYLQDESGIDRNRNRTWYLMLLLFTDCS
ncbi:hypothetical protein C0995_016468 [Termitomyces sp. Mi166|nr:hypothetical protein C0995_016468 [Termitomyces sp. Mi166\